MPKKPDRPKELDALGRKVREASEVIGHLRDTNRALADELEKVKLRLTDGAPASSTGKAEISAELKLLRQERQQIRDRIVHLLEHLDQLSSPPSTD